MWGLFALTILAEIAILYLPGFFLLSLLKWNTATRVVVAPLVSIALYEVFAIAYAEAGVFVSAFSLFIPLLILTACVFVVVFTKNAKVYSMPAPNRRSFKLACRHFADSNVAIMLLYVLVAAIVGLFYFVIPLDGAASFSQESDNTAHLGYIQSFLASGNYSTLDVSLYHDAQSPSETPTGSKEGGFYPAAWHCVAALAASLTGANAAIAANASLFVFVVVVIPLGVFLLIQTVLGGNKVVLCCGAVVSLAFSAFPWGMITFGPLYPNMAAFSLVLPVVCLFVNCIEALLGRDAKGFAGYLAVFSVGLFSLATLQPNAVFTVGVFLVPFCFHSIAKAVQGRSLPIRLVTLVGFVVFVGLMWLIAYKLPFMQSVVGFAWEPFTSLRQAVVNIALLSYSGSTAQPLLAVLVVLGGLACFVQGKNRWLIWTYVLMCFLVLIASFASGSLRSLLTGFWYTDSYRIAAMAALAGLPLAAYGLYSVYGALKWICARCKLGYRNAESPTKGVVACLFVLSFCLLFYPSFSIVGILNVGTPFGDFEARWHDENHSVNICIMDEEEERFLEEVNGVVSSDDVILNIPDDGSVFAYGAYGLDVFYRRTGVAAIGKESAESEIIRQHLAEYANNSSVQEAVESCNAKYLLVLDQGSDPDGHRYWFGHYNSDEWVGIDAVNDYTPGFRVILSEGDMRLYAIESME